MSKPSLTEQLKAKQSEEGAPINTEQGRKTIFEMASDATETEDEEPEYTTGSESEQDDVPTNTKTTKEDTSKWDPEEIMSRFENGEDLSEDEEQYLVDQGYAETVDKDSDAEPNDIEKPQDAEVLEKYFPDEKFKTEEDYSKARDTLYEQYGNIQEELNETKKTTDQIAKVLTDNPEMQGIIKALNKGVSVRAALIEAGFAPSDFEVLEDDDDAEDMIEAQVNAREQKRLKEQQEKEVQENMQQSEKLIEQLQIDDSQKEKLYEKVNTVFQDFIKGKITDDTLNMFSKALNFDKEIEKASEQAARRVRNEKIQLTKKRKTGDGLPKLVSRGRKDTMTKKNEDQFMNSLSSRIIGKPTGLMAMIKAKKGN